MSFFISFNPDKKPCGMHILQKIKHALEMKSPPPPPATHTQHLKEIKRDKQKQKKMGQTESTKPDGRNKFKCTITKLYS